MIIITNGVNVIEVTNGAYNGIFAKQGYYPVDESANKPAQPVTEPEKANSEALTIEQIEEKPISKWNEKEIAFYAAEKGIEIPADAKIAKKRAIVKAAIEIESADDDDDWDDEE